MLWFIPTLLVITLIAFGLKQMLPGDPVVKLCGDQGAMLVDNYGICATQYGLDKPVFYLGLLPAALPDTLHRILPVRRRSILRRLAGQIGRWEPVEAFHHALLELEHQLVEHQRTDEVRQQVIDLRRQYFDIRAEAVVDRLPYFLETFRNYLDADTLAAAYFGPQFTAVETAYTQISSTSSNWRNFLPIPHWYGLDNQYHDWISKVVVGDFGISYEDKRPVVRKIGPALYWTLLISLLAFFWAFLIGIPLGVYSAVYRDTWLDRLISGVVFFLFSLPRFWVATILVLYFTTDYYFSWPNFAGIGLGDVPEDAPFWERFRGVAPHLVLPVFCMAYLLIAFITRQMRRSMIEVLEQDYIRTARSKGMKERQIIWRHAFRNALFPIITMIAGLFPAAIGGSIVIEFIFRIPGMGSTIFNAINREDWPVVFTFLVLSAFLTMLGILVSDLCYALNDPRVRYQQKH